MSRQSKQSLDATMKQDRSSDSATAPLQMAHQAKFLVPVPILCVLSNLALVLAGRLQFQFLGYWTKEPIDLIIRDLQTKANISLNRVEAE